VEEGGVTPPRWTRPESEFLESLAGDLPLKEIVSRYRRRAGQVGWPERTHRGIQQRLIRMGHEARVRTGDWVTTGGAAEILGCPGTRVEAWLRTRHMKEILQPVWRGKFRYVSRAAWRRLARQRPQALGGFSADRLFQLLEDRELAEQVASRYPRPRGDWRVRCVETGQVWPSAVKAAAELHVSQAAITLAMRQARPVRVLGMRFEALREVG
jgi:hypothetical protein